MVAAFGLVIALVWNEAIKEVVHKIIEYFGIPGEGLFKVLVAVIVTIICVIAILLFSRWAEK